MVGQSRKYQKQVEEVSNDNDNNGEKTEKITEIERRTNGTSTRTTN